MSEETRIIQLVGEQQETRHLLAANQQTILSPGWSIHSEAGAGRFGFICSKADDNKDFRDMDFVKMEDLK